MAKWATDAPTKLNYHAISTRTQWPCRKSKKQFKRSQRRDERRKRSTLRVQRTAPRCCDFGQWYGLPFVLTLWAYCQWGLVRLQWSRESWERDQARPHIAIITHLIVLHASLPSFSLTWLIMKFCVLTSVFRISLAVKRMRLKGLEESII